MQGLKNIEDVLHIYTKYKISKPNIYKCRVM